VRRPALFIVTNDIKREPMDEPDNIRILHELIAALDRRPPQIQHAGEASIARDAAASRSVHSNGSPSSNTR
jgi:hypothetical protein